LATSKKEKNYWKKSPRTLHKDKEKNLQAREKGLQAPHIKENQVTTGMLDYQQKVTRRTPGITKKKMEKRDKKKQKRKPEKVKKKKYR
jgi:hypothetical protein